MKILVLDVYPKTKIIRLPLLIDKKKEYIQNNGNLSAL